MGLVGNDSAFVEKLQDVLIKFGYHTAILSSDSAVIPGNLAGLLVVADGQEPPLALLRKAIPILQQNGAQHGGALLVSLTRMDGGLGFKSLDKMALASQAALIGIVKSLSYELPEVTCRCIDVDNEWQGEECFKTIVKALGLGLPIEIGLSAAGATQIILNKEDQEIVAPFVPSASDLVVISGGARGVTAQIARQFAAPGVKLLLLGRSAMPEAQPAWCAGLSTIEQYKKAILANTKERLTPKLLEQQAKKLCSEGEVLATISACQAAGATVLYRSVDVRDEQSVRVAVQDVTRQFGSATILVHGAGVLADGYFINKKNEDYQRVYETKVDGFNNLLSACGDSLEKIVLFSSTTARLGRKGQSDYAAANEVLNKSAEVYARTHQNCVVKAMGWGPWAGGMVNPGLAKLFADEGIGLIGLEDGAQLLARELTLGGSVEVAILGENSLLPAELFVPVELAEPVEDEYIALDELVVCLDNYPILASHKLAGQYVVPFAMAMEWLVQGASKLVEGKIIAEVQNVQMLAGLKVAAEDRLTAYIRAKKLADDRYLIELATRRKDLLLPAYRGEVILSDRLEATPKSQIKLDNPPKINVKSVADVYKKYLFHGKDFQAFKDKPAVSAKGARVRAHSESLDGWLVLVDVAFQLAIVWSSSKEGKPCLPASCASFKQYVHDFAFENVAVEMMLVKKSGASLIFDIEWSENGQLIARMEGYEAVMNESLKEAFKK